MSERVTKVLYQGTAYKIEFLNSQKYGEIRYIFVNGLNFYKASDVFKGYAKNFYRFLCKTPQEYWLQTESGKTHYYFSLRGLRAVYKMLSNADEFLQNKIDWIAYSTNPKSKAFGYNAPFSLASLQKRVQQKSGNYYKYVKVLEFCEDTEFLTLKCILKNKKRKYVQITESHTIEYVSEMLAFWIRKTGGTKNGK